MLVCPFRTHWFVFWTENRIFQCFWVSEGDICPRFMGGTPAFLPPRSEPATPARPLALPQVYSVEAQDYAIHLLDEVRGLTFDGRS